MSAVSKDALEDALNAKSDTVIDEWDEEFDRGKVKGFFFSLDFSNSRSVVALLLSSFSSG